MTHNSNSFFAVYAQNLELMQQLHRQYLEQILPTCHAPIDNWHNNLQNLLDQSLELSQAHNQNIQQGAYPDILKHTTNVMQQAHKFGTEMMKSNLNTLHHATQRHKKDTSA